MYQRIANLRRMMIDGESIGDYNRGISFRVIKLSIIAQRSVMLRNREVGGLYNCT